MRQKGDGDEGAAFLLPPREGEARVKEEQRRRWLKF